MIKNTFFLMALGSMLTACVSNNYINRNKLPSVVYQKSAGFAASSYTSDDDLVVVTKNAKNNSVPASCTLAGKGFSARFVGSSRIIVPMFGRAKNTVNVTCELQGNTQTRQAQVKDITQHMIESHEWVLKKGCKPSGVIGGGNVAVAANIASSGFCNNMLGKANSELKRLKAIPAGEHKYGFTATKDFVF